MKSGLGVLCVEDMEPTHAFFAITWHWEIFEWRRGEYNDPDWRQSNAILFYIPVTDVSELLYGMFLRLQQ